MDGIRDARAFVTHWRVKRQVANHNRGWHLAFAFLAIPNDGSLVTFDGSLVTFGGE